MIKGTERELDEQLQKLQQAYALVFDEKNPSVQLVLEDLSRFCRATESCFHPDPRVHAVLEGRRETFLRIDELRRYSFEEVRRRAIIRRAVERKVLK